MHQQGRERPQDIPILWQGSTSGRFSIHNQFQTLTSYCSPQAQKAELQASINSKCQKAPKWFEVSQGFRFLLFTYRLQIPVSTKIITLSVMLPSLLSFCYITLWNLGKVFWGLVMNLIPSLLLPYVFTEDWLFYSFSSICFLQCYHRTKQVLSNNEKNCQRGFRMPFFGVDLTLLIAPFIFISRRIKLELCTEILEFVPEGYPAYFFTSMLSNLDSQKDLGFLSTLQGALSTPEDSAFYTQNIFTLGRSTLQAALQRPCHLKLF